ncbi:MAG: DNA polymerase IV [Ignavibacteria bacterium]|nr:DNA polymerase IV [Ignavibacteria bacterium]
MLFFHLDLDAFFISVERILEPSLVGKPVIVGGDPKGRGVVAACSYEAREFGLHSAMPIRKAYQLCPQGIYIRGHYEEYVRFSKAVKKILEKYFPQVEQASIDEFYLDYTGCERIHGHPYFFAARVQTEIRHELGLPCSIGIASNKFVAKVASDYAKPEGITFVIPGQEAEFLSPLPVEAMPGVGDVMKEELNSRGFYTIGQIAQAPKAYFAFLFGKYGEVLHDHACGKGSEIIDIKYEQKSISRETTYHTDTTDIELIEKTIFELVEDAGNALRSENFMARTIGIKLRYSDFVTITRAKTIREPTDNDKVIYTITKELFHKAYTRRVSIRLVGVHLSGFVPAIEQMDIFPSREEKERRVLKTIDKLKSKFGEDIISYGVA